MDYNGSNDGNGNKFGSYQYEISQDKSVPYGGSVIYSMAPHMVTHMIPTPPPPSPPQDIYQLTNSINSNNINNVIT